MIFREVSKKNFSLIFREKQSNLFYPANKDCHSSKLRELFTQRQSFMSDKPLAFQQHCCDSLVCVRSWKYMHHLLILPFLGVCSENCKKRLLALSCLSLILSVCMSVRPHGTTRLPLKGFLWNLILENFSKICSESSSFIKIWQEYLVIYMKTNISFFYHNSLTFS